MVARYEYPVGAPKVKAGTARNHLLRHSTAGALYISVVSIAEIRFGIELQPDVIRRAELNKWLTQTLRPAFAARILPVTFSEFAQAVAAVIKTLLPV